MKKLLFGIIIFNLFSGAVFANNTKKATELTLKGLKLNDNSKKELNFYQQAIKADPNYAQAYYNIGNVYFDQKKYTQALEYFIKATKKSKKDPDFWYNLGLTAFIQKDYVVAVQALQALIAINPKDHEGLYLLSKIYFTLQNRTGHNAALQYLQQIIKETQEKTLKKRATKLLDALKSKLKLKN